MDKPKYYRLAVLVHIVVWLLFFFWPLLLFHTEMPQFSRFYIRYLIYPCIAMGLFYLNYNRWIQRYFFPHRILPYIIVNLLGIVLGVLIIHIWQKPVVDWIYGPPTHHRPPISIPWFFMFQNFLNLVMIVVVALVVRVSVRWYESEIERQALAKEKNLVELKNLKSQLHPHFLFNTLNNIYALISIEPDKAKTAVYDLGGLLRYVLKEGDRDEVPLDDEVAFMKNYIALMSLRLGSKTELCVELPDKQESGGCFIPSLLFINLIENAFKYGVSTQESSIKIVLRPDREKKVLSFSCRNTLGQREKQYLLQQDTGVGLSNLQKRLEYIYGPGGYYFRTDMRESVYLAELVIPLKKKE